VPVGVNVVSEAQNGHFLRVASKSFVTGGPVSGISSNLSDSAIVRAPFRAGHCTAHTAARPDRTPPDRSEAGEEADGVTAARRWRDVCRLDH